MARLFAAIVCLVVTAGCAEAQQRADSVARAIDPGASAEDIRNAVELRTLGGCPPSDTNMKTSAKQED